MDRIFVSLVVLFALISPVFAQEINTSVSPTTPSPSSLTPSEKRSNIKQERQDLRQNIKEEKQDLRQNIREEKQDIRQGAKEAISQERENIRQFRQEEIKKFQEERGKAKATIEKQKEEFRQRIETKREEVKERIQTKREELKQNLAKIKDERKKQIAERVYNNLNELNKRMTDHFVDVLNRLESAIEKINDRIAKAEANGKDVSTVKSAVANAEQAIAASRSAVENQSKKTYDFTFDSEEALRLNIGKARQTLQSDIEIARKTVFDSRDAVKKAAVALAQIPRVDELEVTTTPAAATPSQ